MPDSVEAQQSWNVAPTPMVPIIRDLDDADGHRDLKTARWGLFVSPVKGLYAVHTSGKPPRI